LNCFYLNLELLLSRYWIITIRSLLIFLTISRVTELRFKRDWSRWKAKTWGYKFSKGRRTHFCLQDSQNCSWTNIWTVTVQLLLSCFWTVIVRPLLRCLTISRVIELRFKLDWSHWKAKTWGYKFSEGRRTHFSLQDSQNWSSTNIWTVSVQLLQSCFWTVAVRPLLIFLTISRVRELHFKRDWSRSKAKTWGYKFFEGRRTQFSLQDS